MPKGSYEAYLFKSLCPEFPESIREMLAQELDYASFVENLSYGQLDEIMKDYAGDEGSALSEAHRAL